MGGPDPPQRRPGRDARLVASVPPRAGRLASAHGTYRQAAGCSTRSYASSSDRHGSTARVSKLWGGQPDGGLAEPVGPRQAVARRDRAWRPGRLGLGLAILMLPLRRGVLGLRYGRPRTSSVHAGRDRDGVVLRGAIAGGRRQGRRSGLRPRGRGPPCAGSGSRSVRHTAMALAVALGGLDPDLVADTTGGGCDVAAAGPCAARGFRSRGWGTRRGGPAGPCRAHSRRSSHVTAGAKITHPRRSRFSFAGTGDGTETQLDGGR